MQGKATKKTYNSCSVISCATTEVLKYAGHLKPNVKKVTKYGQITTICDITNSFIPKTGCWSNMTQTGMWCGNFRTSSEQTWRMVVELKTHLYGMFHRWIGNRWASWLAMKRECLKGFRARMGRGPPLCVEAHTNEFMYNCQEFIFYRPCGYQTGLPAVQTCLPLKMSGVLWKYNIADPGVWSRTSRKTGKEFHLWSFNH